MQVYADNAATTKVSEKVKQAMLPFFDEFYGNASSMYAFGQQTKPIYSKWIREYITTVLVQPFHMIVYSILISLPLNHN